MFRQMIGPVMAAVAMLAAIPAVSAEPVQIPAKFEGNAVYLQVRLNDGAPVWMRFDVGASDSVLSPAGGATLAKASVADVKLGPVDLQHVYFDRDQPVAATGPDGQAVAGRLGEDALGNRVLIVRYADKKVFLSEPVQTASVPFPKPVGGTTAIAYSGH